VSCSLACGQHSKADTRGSSGDTCAAIWAQAGNGSGAVQGVQQIPTSLQVLSTGVATNAYANSLPNGCPPTSVPGLGGGTAGPYGMFISVKYQVMDQQNPAKPIKATLPLREDLTNFKTDSQSSGADRKNVNVTSSGTSSLRRYLY
jgi:hypothetical protein